VKGERSNRQLRRHVDRLNADAAHKVARRIAQVCAQYPGCILLFERLRKIKPGKGSKSRRMNRRRANQLRGKINQQAKDKAYLHGVVSVEVNAHGTSQYCSRCGAKGEGFSYKSGRRIPVKWGKLFICPMCHYEANAYFNASVNVHHSFYREMWRERREGRTESGRRECCVQVCQRIWATVDTTTQARLAMGGRAELESHLPLLELAGRAPARSS
jgi:IS605 OrfB family transposase